MPYGESGYRLLMETLHREGNNADAVAVYEHLRQILRDQLGTMRNASTCAPRNQLLEATS